MQSRPKMMNHHTSIYYKTKLDALWEKQISDSKYNTAYLAGEGVGEGGEGKGVCVCEAGEGVGEGGGGKGVCVYVCVCVCEAGEGVGEGGGGKGVCVREEKGEKTGGRMHVRKGGGERRENARRRKEA